MRTEEKNESVQIAVRRLLAAAFQLNAGKSTLMTLAELQEWLEWFVTTAGQRDVSKPN